MGSLRRIKEDVEEVSEGVECGLSADGFFDWKEGDKIDCYAVSSKPEAFWFGSLWLL